MATQQWFISREGKLKGPYTLAQLQQMVKTAELQPADLLCPEGGAPTRAQRVPGLFPPPSPPPAPVAPVPARAALPPEPVAVAPPAPVQWTEPVAVDASPSRSRGMSTGLLVGIGAGTLLLGCLCTGGIGLAWRLKADAASALPKKTEVAQQDTPKTAKASEPVTPVAMAPKAKPIWTKAKLAEVERLDAAPPIAPKVVPVKGADAAQMSPRARDAVGRGVALLKQRTAGLPAADNIDGKHGGEQCVGVAALAGLALLEAKVPPSDPAVQRVLAKVRAASGALGYTYSLAASLLFLNRLHEIEPLSEGDRRVVRTLTLRLVAGQKPDGRWSYNSPVISGAVEDDLIRKLENDNYRPGISGGGNGDNSQTQFAILALWGSRRLDMPVRPALLAAAACFHNSQNANGSWGYNGAEVPFSDSNSCAGLIALAIERTLLDAARAPGRRDVADKQRDRAFAYLGKVIGRKRNDPQASHNLSNLNGHVVKANAYGDYYFLWCLERVGVVYDRAMIGGKDWYAWGSQVVLDNQRPDGSWSDQHGEVCDTSFAILFLTRANIAYDLTESIRTQQSGAKQP